MHKVLPAWSALAAFCIKTAQCASEREEGTAGRAAHGAELQNRVLHLRFCARLMCA